MASSSSIPLADKMSFGNLTLRLKHGLDNEEPDKHDFDKKTPEGELDETMDVDDDEEAALDRSAGPSFGDSAASGASGTSKSTSFLSSAPGRASSASGKPLTRKQKRYRAYKAKIAAVKRSEIKKEASYFDFQENSDRIVLLQYENNKMKDGKTKLSAEEVAKQTAENDEQLVWRKAMQGLMTDHPTLESQLPASPAVVDDPMDDIINDETL